MAATDTAKPIELNGRAALVANVSAHDADPKNFSAFLDLITDAAGRIRKRPGIGSAQGAAAAAAVTAMYEFVVVTGLAVDYYLFRATGAANANAIQYRKNGGAWTNTTLPYVPTVAGLWVFETIDKRCVAVNGYNDAVVFDGSTNNWVTFGVEGPLTPPGYAALAGYTVGNVVSAINGNKHVIGTAPAVWSVATMDGHRITINGVNYTISHVTATGNGVGVPPEADLTENFKEVTAGGLPYTIFDGPCTWDTPPTYFYGYYNPTSGHRGNTRHSSLLNDNGLTIAESNQVGQKLTINNLAYDPVAYAQGFTKILLYRTPNDGNIARALDPAIVNLNNSNGAGTTSWTETAASWSDTALLDWAAQRTKLGKPPTGLRSIRYRMGRLHAIKENRDHFSLHEIETLTQGAISSESWPSNNNRLIKANQTRGLVILGTDTGSEMLIVQSGDGDFQVVGFDQSDMLVPKLSTKHDGSFQYGAIDSNGELVSLYMDRRLVGFPGETDYGFAIKDKLDLMDLTNLPGARLHRFSGIFGDFLLLSCRRTSGSSTNDVTYVFDFMASQVASRPIWYEWSRGFTAFATAHNTATGALEMWGSTGAGNSYLLLQAGVWQDDAANFAPMFRTVNLRPWGETFEGDFFEAQIFVSNASFAWTGELLRNEEAAGAGVAFTFSATRQDDQAAQGRQLEWVPSQGVRTRGKTHQISVSWPSQNSDLYVEKAIVLVSAGQTVANS